MKDIVGIEVWNRFASALEIDQIRTSVEDVRDRDIVREIRCFAVHRIAHACSNDKRGRRGNTFEESPCPRLHRKFV